MSHTRKIVRTDIGKYIYNRNRTHYLKWTINSEWSIRYYFTYDARNQYNGQWVLKSHYTKDYIIVTKDEAMDYIQYYCYNTYPKEYFSLQEFGKGYRRTVIDPKIGTDCFIERKI